MTPTGYKMVPFSHAVRDCTGGNLKVQRKDYLAKGEVPVIDQGQNFIAGFTNAENGYRGSLPLILFGDHTRAFKYVDFPFALGADGVKALEPLEGFSAKFLNYYFRFVQLPSAGYSRHFKFLKEISVPKPTLPEQRRIVDILSRAEGIVRLRREAQRKSAELIPGIFIDMFGDPATNPKGWPTALFGEVGVLDRGRSRHRPRDAKELYGGPYPFIQTGDVANSGGRINSYSSTYSEAGLAQSKLWQKGTLCITIAANIAKTGVLEFDACFPDSVVGFLPTNRVRTAFVQAWLGFLQPTLEANAPQAAQKNINLEILRNLPIPVPPLALQETFEQRCSDVVSIHSQQSAATAKAEATFGALLAKVFATNHITQTSI